MLRDTMIDRWVEELDREIYDLLELREEVAGEELVIEDGTVRQGATTVLLSRDYDEEMQSGNEALNMLLELDRRAKQVREKRLEQIRKEKKDA